MEHMVIDFNEVNTLYCANSEQIKTFSDLPTYDISFQYLTDNDFVCVCVCVCVHYAVCFVWFQFCL